MGQCLLGLLGDGCLFAGERCGGKGADRRGLQRGRVPGGLGELKPSGGRGLGEQVILLNILSGELRLECAQVQQLQRELRQIH